MRVPPVPALAVMAMVMFAGCDDVQAPQQWSDANPVTLTAEHRLPDGTVLPPGTILSDAQDEAGRPFLRFQLPEGYKLVGMSTESSGGDARLYDGGGLTCTCEKGSGCSPFKANGPGGTVTGCAMNEGCTKCTGEVEPTVAGAEGGLRLLRGREVDVLDLAAGISFVTDPAELASLSCPRNVVLQYAGFTDGLAQFLDGYQLKDRAAVRAARSRAELPESYTMMFVNVYGKVVRVPIQRGITISEVVARNSFALRGGEVAGDPLVARDGATASSAGEETTCQCLTGGSGCTYEKKSVWPIGYAEWCEAGGCVSCRMETPT